MSINSSFVNKIFYIIWIQNEFYCPTHFFNEIALTSSQKPKFSYLNLICITEEILKYKRYCKKELYRIMKYNSNCE